MIQNRWPVHTEQRPLSLILFDATSSRFSTCATCRWQPLSWPSCHRSLPIPHRRRTNGVSSRLSGIHVSCWLIYQARAETGGTPLQTGQVRLETCLSWTKGSYTAVIIIQHFCTHFWTLSAIMGTEKPVSNVLKKDTLILFWKCKKKKFEDQICKQLF